MNDITMPRLSDSMESGTILTWLVADGDTVAAGDELVEIETDKANMTYESPAAGTLTIAAAPGETLPVGTVIARVGSPADVAAPAPPTGGSDGAPASAPAGPVPAPPAGSASPANGNGAAVLATPVARRIAASHGVDLASLAGTGPHGRITRADVAAAAGIAAPAAPAPAAPIASPAEPARPAPATSVAPADPNPAAGDGPQLQELSRLQQTVARRMAEAKATVPEFQVQTEVTMDAALALRAELKATAADGDAAPSVNDLIVKAAALALRQHPLANGSYKDGRFELHPRVNVGIAVAAAGALVVPTITDADTRSLGAIAAEARRLAARVRDSEITPAELSGGTFTVSNLGMYGMTAITPVINMPQAAILGAGATRPVLARDPDGDIVDRHRMTLTLTCDHRIIYGADAARFLAAIRDLLEAPLRLAL